MNQGRVLSWSHSRLLDFERCRQVTWLKSVQHVPEPERELPPGKTEHANDRGSRVHESMEAYGRGDSDIILPEALDFAVELGALRRLFKLGTASFEGEWAMDRGWNPVDWKSEEAWLRLKLDALVHLSPIEAVAIDYKTGRIFGNEIKHSEQLNLYVLCTFLRFPLLETVTAELWYLDHNAITSRTMTRAQSLGFKYRFDSRGNKLTTCTTFPPNPSKHACKWCPYRNTEHCLVGV